MMLQGAWMGVPYLPPQPPPPPEMMFGVKVLIFVSVVALISLLFIAYAKLEDKWRDRKRRTLTVRNKFKAGIVPGWVFRDEDSMKLWLRMYMGVEPEQWRVDMLLALKDARISAFRRANIGKGYSLEAIKQKITEEP